MLPDVDYVHKGQTGNLAELARRQGTDKYGHGYCPLYERHFGLLTESPVSLLEVGVYRGCSLRMWAAYFPRGRIVGVDIDEQCAESADGRIEVVVADINAYQPDRDFDIIVDDGSHMAPDVIAAHALLWPHLRHGGWYVIEDLNTVAMRTFGGGPDGVPVLPWLWEALTPTVLGRAVSKWGICEAHIYPQIAFMRKT